MIERLSWYVALLAAVGFGVLKSVLFIQKIRAGVALTEPGYFDLANILIAVAAVWIGTRGLKREGREKRAGAPNAVASDKPPAVPCVVEFRQMPETYKRAFRQHPSLLTVLIAILAALPIVLWSLAMGRGPARFGPADWMLVGLAELPMVVALGLIVWAFGKSQAP